MNKYGKSYKEKEKYEAHKREYLASLKIIEKHSIFSDYYLGLNHMSDWTKQEYESILGIFDKDYEYDADNFLNDKI